MNPTPYQVLQNSPFLLQRVPRLGATIRMHGRPLRLSENSIEAGRRIDEVDRASSQKKSLKGRQLERDIFDLTRADDQ